MAVKVRVVVVGEGPDEHGVSARGPDLHPLPAGWKEGSLLTIVRRILAERFHRPCELLCWLAPVPGRTRRPLNPAELLLHEHWLPTFLRKLLEPLHRQPATLPAADVVILSMDGDKRAAFERTVRRLPPDLREKVIPVVFEPEYEVLFTRSKRPLETALGLPFCSTSPPRRDGDLKKSMQDWLRQHQPERRLDASFRQEIAQHLNVGPNSELEEVDAWRELVNRLSAWKA